MTKRYYKFSNLLKSDNMVNLVMVKEWEWNITVFKNLQKFLTKQKPNKYNQTVEF